MADTAQQDYLSLSDIVKNPGKLAEKRKELHTMRSRDMREWALNRAFYNDNQWAFWNRVTSQVESLPTDDGDKPRYKVRLVDNQIKPGLQYLVALMTKTRPVITATPDSGSYRDIMSAQMGEALYEDWTQKFSLTPKLQSVLMHSGLSAGFWLIDWDPLAGVPLKTLLDPQSGQPVTDGELADAYRSAIETQAQQMGVDPAVVFAQYERVQYVGEISVKVMPGENVYLDPTASMFEDCKYAITKHSMDCDEVAARWGTKVTPNSVPDEAEVPLMFVKDQGGKSKSTRDVYCGYFKPQPALPKGRYVVWIEGPDTILYQSDWNLPFNDLPLVKFPGIERPNSVYDSPVVTTVRPLQKDLNRTRSQIIEHKNLTIKPQMVAPYGSLRQRLTGEPGAVFEYNPIQGLAPDWRPQPPLPQYVFAHLESIKQEIDRKFHRLPSSRDALPARMDSGYGVDMIQEAVADELSPTIQRMEDALAKAGDIMVKLAQQYYTEPRMLSIKGANGAVQVKKFKNADLSGGFSFHAEAGSGLPRSRAGRQQRILELVDKQVLSPTQGMRYLDLADLKGLQSKFQQDEDAAYRTIQKLITGEPVNQTAVQQTQQMVMQALNDPTADPDGDGQPDSMEEKQQWAAQQLQQAALQPLPFWDPDAHMDVLGQYMKSVEFEQLPLDAQQRFQDHWSACLDFSISLRRAALQFDASNMPKVNVTTRSTVSAPVLQKILEAHGIQVTEEEVEEAPLETAVYDSVDKPDDQQTGNNPLQAWEQAQAIQQADSKHSLAQAKAAHELSSAQHTNQLSQQQAMQDQTHAAEKHAMDLQHAHELHQAKLAQARQPKPSTGKKKKSSGR